MITSIIQGGRNQGMQLMDDALMTLVEQQRISPREAYMKATNKAKFEPMVQDDEA
jgi:twitching motility protein PilT